jgi:hypothetical protein
MKLRDMMNPYRYLILSYDIVLIYQYHVTSVQDIRFMQDVLAGGKLQCHTTNKGITD